MMIDRTQAAGFVNNATALTDLEKAGLLKFVVLLTDEELRILPEKPEVVIAYVDNKRKEADLKNDASKAGVSGKGNKQGSPVGPAHQAPARSVAFARSEHTLEEYCPGLKIMKFDHQLSELRGVDGVCTAIAVPTVDEAPVLVIKKCLLTSLLSQDIASINEASKVLKLHRVIAKLLKRNPFAGNTRFAVMAEEAESEKVAAPQEATSRAFALQQLAHEEWLRVKGVVHGRVELQVRCTQPNGKSYLMGACEAADDLDTATKLNKKLEQVAKEAFAIWHTNARSGFEAMPVKMLLTDGDWFMRVDLKIDTPYQKDMNLSKVTGSFSASPSFSLTDGKELGPEHALDAVRLLLSWLWEGDLCGVTAEHVQDALQSFRHRVARRVRLHELQTKKLGEALAEAEAEAEAEAQESAKKKAKF